MGLIYNTWEAHIARPDNPKGKHMSNAMTTAELEKIHSEIAKLMAETSKLNAETTKLRAESGKLSREMFWYPVAIASGLVGAVAAATLALTKYFS
jgi:hypothetical protein